MANKDIVNHGFKNDSDRAREAGKKSKRGKSWRTVIQQLCENEYDTPDKIKKFFPDGKYSAKEIAVMAMIVKAWKGDVNAVKWLSETEDGKPKQPLTGDDDLPINIKVNF